MKERWRRLDGGERIALASVAAGLLCVIVLALWLTPDARGAGTHRQLGLRPCVTAEYLGVPCPFCGMTTAFSLMAHGHFVEAFHTQPAGALGFLAAIVGMLLCAGTALTGRGPTGLLSRRITTPICILAALIVLAAWLYKIWLAA